MLYGRTNRDAVLIADGPSRAPLRYEVASSHGMPRNTAAAFPMSRCKGRRPKVAACANRGETEASSGSGTRPRSRQSGGSSLRANEVATPWRPRGNHGTPQYQVAPPTKTRTIERWAVARGVVR